jgi:hypothetical protein
MEKTSAKIKRPLWVAGLNIALALTVGSTQSFAADINSVADLLAVSGDANYVLKVDLDLSNDDASSAEGEQLADEETSGDPSYIPNGFTGILDGGGRTISGLTKPLFNEIGGDGVSSEISNLTLIADESTGVSGRGILANATLIGTEIVKVHGVGDLNGGASANVGGLVGTLGTGEISESSFTGGVTGTSVVGGLVGEASGNISNSTFSGTVTGKRYVGGIAGVTGAQIISDSSASGSVTGIAGGEGKIGGLVGGGSGAITNSHADVNVTGAAYVPSENGNNALAGNESIGGLLGWGDLSVTINNSYSTGSVTGDVKVGGLVGTLAGGYIEESYSTGDVFGRTNGSIGGLVGYADSGSGSGTFRGIVNAGSVLSSLIESSYATGDVTQIGSGNDGGGVGGLVGSLYSGTILNSYSTGDVRGETTVGGLVGRVYEYGVNPGLTYDALPYANYKGLIENSYSTSTINLGNNGANRLGGLVGIFSGGKIVNSYATAGGLGIDASSGCDHIGGLVGDGSGFGGAGSGIIQNSFAYIEGNVSAGCGQVGGLAGSMGVGSTITNSFAYVSGSIIGGNQVGGLVGVFYGDLGSITGSYSSVNSLASSSEIEIRGTFIGGRWAQVEGYDEEEDNWFLLPAYLDTPPINFTEEQIIDLPALPSILSVVNTDDETEPFAVSSCFNSGLPYLTALTNSYSNTCSVDVEVSTRVNFPFLLTQALDALSKSVGFEAAKSDLSKLDLALLDQVKGDKSAPITGAKLLSYQSLLTSLSFGNLLQLEINFEGNKSLQMWVKSLDDQYVFLGDVTFDKDGNALLPGIEFKKSGQYEIIFVNSDKKDLTQPELVNKVSGLTIYVN